MATANSIDLHYRHGNALRLRGAFVEAETVLREVLQRAPDHRDAAYSMAHMLREDGRLNAAADVIATLWKNRPGSAEEALAALTFLVECGAYGQASAIAHDAHSRWRDDARVIAKLGEILLALGAFDDASAALREAIDRDPAQGSSWLRLAYCRRFTGRDDVDVRRFEHGWADAHLGGEARICAGFALGKALDDIGDYSRAATVLRDANAHARAASSWRSQTWRDRMDARLNATRMPTLQADPEFVPVFIVGMPRTGTTLIASSLASFGEVRDRGELNWIGMLHAHLQAQGQVRDARALTHVARLIRAQMRRDDAPARFYIDKNPLNFLYLDFIAAMFPGARIIHCRRASRDTALSLWMQHFVHEDMGFAYDFSTIAEVEASYRRLMMHWCQSLNVRIIDLDYESFVAQPEQQRQRLADLLGMDRSRAFPSRRSDVITTASVWQVRQPVYTHAVERWRRYAPYLPELTKLFAGRD